MLGPWIRPVRKIQPALPIRTGEAFWRIVPVTLTLCLAPVLGIVNFIGLADLRICGLLSVLQCINGMLLVAMFMALPGSRIDLLMRTNLLTPLLLLAMYALGTAVFQEQSLPQVVQGFYIVFLYLIFISVREFSRRGWLGLMWCRTIPRVVLCLVVFSQVLGRLFVTTEKGHAYALAATGIADNPSLIGGFAVALLPWCLVPVGKCSMRVAGVVLVFGIVATSMRRNAFVVIALTLVAMVIYQTLRARRAGSKLAAITTFLLICSFFSLFLFYTAMGDAFIARLEGLNILKGATASGRTEFQVVILKHLVSRGVIGSLFGEGTSATADVIESGWGARIGAHNAWLDLTTAFGAVGFVLLAWFHLNVGGLYLQAEGARRMAAFGVVTIVYVGGVVMNGLYGPCHGLLYAYLGVLSATNTMPSGRSNERGAVMKWRPVSFGHLPVHGVGN